MTRAQSYSLYILLLLFLEHISEKLLIHFIWHLCSKFSVEIVPVCYTLIALWFREAIFVVRNLKGIFVCQLLRLIDVDFYVRELLATNVFISDLFWRCHNLWHLLLVKVNRPQVIIRFFPDDNVLSARRISLTERYGGISKTFLSDRSERFQCSFIEGFCGYGNWNGVFVKLDSTFESLVNQEHCIIIESPVHLYDRVLLLVVVAADE